MRGDYSSLVLLSFDPDYFPPYNLVFGYVRGRPERYVVAVECLALVGAILVESQGGPEILLESFAPPFLVSSVVHTPRCRAVTVLT